MLQKRESCWSSAVVQELDEAKAEVQTLLERIREHEEHAAQELAAVRAEAQQQASDLHASMTLQAEQHSIAVTKMQSQLDECCDRLQETVARHADVSIANQPCRMQTRPAFQLPDSCPVRVCNECACSLKLPSSRCWET